jgi:hypothetical protein
MEQSLYELLRRCTVRVSTSEKLGHGTGFFVAPGLILTCAHVVKAVQPETSSIEMSWNGHLYPALITRCVSDADLALLEVDLTDHPCVLLHEEVSPFDTLYSYGYPDDHPSGDPATFTLEGRAGEQGEQLKFKTGQVRPGMSGAPILNVRTGGVCGIVQLTRDRTSDLGGRAIPTTTVFKVFPEIVALQNQFHLQDRSWKKFLKEYRASPPINQNRLQMLERVHTTWISGILDQPLHGAALLALGLQEKTDVVANPWKLVVQEVDQPARQLPSGTSITEVYDSSDDTLLILGEPGAGKTTLLLELARDLLDRAKQDDTLPMPVVFHLSSWGVKRQPIMDWLVEELNTKYQVPRKLGKEWVETDRVMLLLDGLDEVAYEYRTPCVQAINIYRREHGLVPLVVCSRTTEYLALAEQLLLHSAVVIQPLTSQQINDYLSSAGSQLEAVRAALQKDSIWQELTTTPLMLSVLTLAYQGKPVEDLLTPASSKARRQQVFEQYVQRMLQRRSLETSYTPLQTFHWLTWLARQLVQHNQMEFYIEQMQPGWLPESQSHRIYEFLAVKLPDMLIGGIVSLLIITMLFETVFSLPYALCYGIFGGLVGGLISRGNRVRPSAECNVPLWRSLWRNVANVRYVRNGLIIGLCYGLVYGWYKGLNFGLAYGLSFGLTSTLLSAILEKRMLARPFTKKTAWSKKNLWYQLITSGYLGIGLSTGLSYALAYIMSTELANRLHTTQSNVLAYGLVYLLDYTLVGIILCIILERRKPGVQPAEVIIWSWSSFWRGLVNIKHIGNGVLVGALVGLIMGFSAGLIFGLGKGLSLELNAGVRYGLIAWLAFGLSYWLLLGLFRGLSSDMLDKHLHVKPNQGIRRSARNSVLIGLISGLVSWLVCSLSYSLFFLVLYGLGPAMGVGQSVGRSFGLLIGLGVGLLWGLLNGGLACIEHYVLRLLFWQAGSINWNIPNFLDYAVERILLRKVGGGYIFVHRLLLEYFVSLDAA